MNRIAVFDTSIGSLNHGDCIIMAALYNEMDYLFRDNFVVSFATHTPISKSYQGIKVGNVFRYLDSSKYKFIGGTNIFNHSLFHANPDWNANMLDVKYYRNSISVGCGSYLESKPLDWYTKSFYKHVLRKDIIHSTRDEKTKLLLETLGFKAINTGCPTMWGFTEEHCASIPRRKSDNVVFTLTDYSTNTRLDQALIDILQKSYKKLYFWPQGANDYAYFQSLNNIDSVSVLSPNLRSFEELLKTDVDYVGTRLHAGLMAIRMKKRSVIISIDERASAIDVSYNISCIDRDNIPDELESRISTDFITDIHIDSDKINYWKDQFR